MGIGMKTRNDSSNKGTFNQAPKRKLNKQNNTQKASMQSQMQNRPKKRVSDAQWHSINDEERDARNRSTIARNARDRSTTTRNVKQQYKSSQYNDSPYEEEEDFTSQNTNNNTHKKWILIIAAIALIAIGCGIFYLFSQVNSTNNNKTPTHSKLLTKPAEEDTSDNYGDTSEEGTTADKGFETGDSNSEGGKYEEGTLSKTTPEHYSSSDFLKDLNGYEIPAVYTVQNITYDVAHVNYQAKRATIDDGMEFYWLEINYNGKKYRAQCSYNMFRNLESEGICKVAVEILTLDSGQQVVSYMKVVSEDYTVDDAENDFNF